MIQVSNNLYVLTDTPSNVGFLVTKAGVVMIDAPMRPSAAMKMRAEAEKRGEIRYCINTEEHLDHWQGNYFYPGVLISSAITRKTLAARTTVDENIGYVKHNEPESLPLVENYKIRLADIAFTDGMTLRLGDHTLQMFPVPGHSEGGVAVYLPEERVVFTADSVFHKCMSRFPHGDPAKWLVSLQRLGELAVDVVVPGHGELCSKNYIPEQAAVIQKWIDAAKSAMRQGLSAEEAARMTPPDPYPKQPSQNLTEPEIVRLNFKRLYQLYS